MNYSRNSFSTPARIGELELSSAALTYIATQVLINVSLTPYVMCSVIFCVDAAVEAKISMR